MARTPLLLATLVALLSAAACGGSNGKTPGVTPQDTLAALPSQTPTAAAPSPSPSATPSPSPTATPDNAKERNAVLQAAAAELDALAVSPLTRDACLKDNPSQKVCIDLSPADQSLAGGIARLAGGDPQGGGFAFLMGRAADGQWHFWYGTQQAYWVLTTLPGDLLACANGKGAVIHQQPAASSPAVSTVPDLAKLHAEEFVLAQPGSFRAGGARGSGWYRVSSPASGWVSSDDETDAAQGNCQLHDAVLGTGSRG